jgi:rod shape determining protein RodA
VDRKRILEGTQTKGGFVPEQHTDYIFTTVGEEWGFAGSIVIGLFVTLFLSNLSCRKKN